MPLRDVEYVLQKLNWMRAEKNLAERAALFVDGCIRCHPYETPIALPTGEVTPLGEFRDLVREAPGMKIGYATDLRDNASNRNALAALFAGADIVFIEASFAAIDADRAFERTHLTTRAVGEIARQCGAKRVEPFHFSPRYKAEEHELLAEVEAAFSAVVPENVEAKKAKSR